MAANRSFHDNDGYIVLDPVLMDKLRLDEGLSRRQFAELADTAPTTAYRFFNSQRVQTRIARRLFNNLGIEDMRPYLIGGARSQDTEFHELDAKEVSVHEICRRNADRH